MVTSESHSQGVLLLHADDRYLGVTDDGKHVIFPS